MLTAYSWATQPPIFYNLYASVDLWLSSMGYSNVNRDIGIVEEVIITPNHHTGKFSIAFTTLHEIGHVLAPLDAGHGEQWIAACLSLGIKATPTDDGKLQENPDRWDPALYAKVAEMEMEWP